MAPRSRPPKTAPSSMSARASRVTATSILIRHPNGYVSAYAHLKAMAVSKNDVVQRGDSIGTAGMTGSVSKPQLHFELRKGATPVDPGPAAGQLNPTYEATRVEIPA